MSKIGKNIRKIRVVKQLSQASFAQIFNLARPSVGAYEEGRSEPKIDTVVQIALYFGLSVDTLLTKELTINDLFRFDALKSKRQAAGAEPGIPQKKEILLNTTAIQVKDQIDYIKDHLKSDFIDSLPRYHFPGINSTNARLFEIAGDSMTFENKGILPGDMVLSEVKLERMDSFQVDLLYMLVMQDRLILRRFKSGGNKLSFTSDNPDFPVEEYEIHEVLEAWQVFAVFTRSLVLIIPYKERISELEDQFAKLASRMEEIEKTGKTIPDISENLSKD